MTITGNCISATCWHNLVRMFEHCFAHAMTEAGWPDAVLVLNDVPLTLTAEVTHTGEEEALLFYQFVWNGEKADSKELHDQEKIVEWLVPRLRALREAQNIPPVAHEAGDDDGPAPTVPTPRRLAN